MLYELISPDDYDNLPDDPGQQFIEIERICRKNMNEILSGEFRSRANDENDQFAYNIRLQYMTTVEAAALALNVSGVEMPDEINNMNYTFERFLLAASGAVTRLRLIGRKGRKTETVQLAARTRGLIELRIRKLREAIETGEMPEKKREALLARLDALLAEINSPRRVSFATVMTALAFIAAGTSGIADAPMAIANITEWIGLDKEAEDAEMLRLSGPPKAIPHIPSPALPAERPRRPTPNAPAFSPDDDSDIPF